MIEKYCDDWKILWWWKIEMKNRNNNDNDNDNKVL